MAAGRGVVAAGTGPVAGGPVRVGPTAVDPVPVWCRSCVPVVPVPVVPLPSCRCLSCRCLSCRCPGAGAVVPVRWCRCRWCRCRSCRCVPVSVLVVPPSSTGRPVVPVRGPPVPPVVVPVVARGPGRRVCGLGDHGRCGSASLPDVRGAPWARTEVSGSVFRLGVVVEVRFGSPGSGGVSATTASSIRCWSTSRVWPSSSRTLGSVAAIAASSCLASSGCRWLSRSWARSRPALTTCAALIDSARSAKKTLVIAHAGSPGCAVPPLAAAPLTPSAATTTATAARRSGCPGGAPGRGDGCAGSRCGRGRAG